MKNMMFARIVALSFLFFAIQIMPPANSFVSKAQSQSTAPSVEGTVWQAEHSEAYSTMLDETLTREFVCSFGKQGKVTCDINVRASAKSKYEQQYDPIEKRYRYKPVYVPSHRVIELSGSRDGTYKQNGNSVHIEISTYKIDATIKGNQMYGEATLALESNQKVRWIARRTSGGVSSPSASDDEESLPPNVIREPNGKLHPAEGYRWVNAKDPDDFRVERIPRVDRSGDESTQSRTKPTTQDSSVGGLSIGTYKGIAIAASDGARGTIRITIQSIDKEGNVKATVRYSGDLAGEGNVTGNVDARGNLRLRGVLITTVNRVLEWDCILTAKVEGDTLINGQDYSRERSTGYESRGSFNVAKLEGSN